MIEKSLVIAMFVMFVHSTTWNGMIFSRVADWFACKPKLKWLQEISFGCPICACPYWGSLIYWVAWHNSILEWVLVIFAAGGINTVIVKLWHR